MKKYKGYYIDNVVFHNEAEIDEAIKRQAIEKFKTLCRYFSDNATLEASIECDKQAEVLHEQYGFSYAKIEALEIEAIA